MEALIQILHTTPVWIMALAFLLENLIIFGGTLIVGARIAHLYASRAVAEAAEPVSGEEILLASTTILLNSLVTLAGLYLWRGGFIRLRSEFSLTVVLDFLILVLAMDVAMYIAHRIAHIPWIFRIVHRTHHRYENPRPLTLFVLNPLECLSFGILWLALLCVYQATWLGMAAYLMFNVLFGLIGHIGVEPFPDRWKTHPVLKYVSTSSFHAGHHGDENHNFGFYTLIWDRLFGTLAPRYEKDFARRPRTGAEVIE